jgi:tripartite-type tricarboxylate transporter receptor subunit TctC
MCSVAETKNLKAASTRLPTLPDIPPFSEAANARDFEAVSWHILFAPAKTPRNIVDRLHTEMQRIMAVTTMQKLVADLGLIPLDSPSIEGIESYMASEREKWGRW